MKVHSGACRCVNTCQPIKKQPWITLPHLYPTRLRLQVQQQNWAGQRQRGIRCNLSSCIIHFSRKSWRVCVYVCVFLCFRHIRDAVLEGQTIWMSFRLKTDVIILPLGKAVWTAASVARLSFFIPFFVSDIIVRLWNNIAGFAGFAGFAGLLKCSCLGVLQWKYTVFWLPLYLPVCQLQYVHFFGLFLGR